MLKRFLRILLYQVIFFGLLLYLVMNKHNKDSLGKAIVSVDYENSTIENQAYKSKLYEEIEKALLEGEESIGMKNLNLFKDPKDLFKILETISNTNPEVMYYKGAEYHFGSLRLSYMKARDELLEHRKMIQKKREEIIKNNINNTMTDYEKLLVVHDYIINNARYDERLMDSGSIPAESYSTYGILIEGVGVCEGYAKSLKYLLDALDIESHIVVGESKNESHAWNLVRLGGDYYHVDPTWNDPISPTGKDILRHNFFNLTDDEISRTHHWKMEDYPEAKGKKYNYYNYNNLIVDDISDIDEILKSYILGKEKKASVKVKKLGFDNSIINSIIEDINYENYNRLNLKSYSYSIDEDYGIINFDFFYD